MGVEGEINFSFIGTLFGIGASLIGTFYTIYLKHFMDDIVQDQWLLSFYNNFNSCLIIPVLIVVNKEIPILQATVPTLPFSYYSNIFIAGIIGLFVGLTTQLQVKYTSTLSHNISGVFKNCIQTFFGAAYYKTPLTGKGVCGVMLVVAGSFAYAMERIRINAKEKEMNKEQTMNLINKEEPSVIDE